MGNATEMIIAIFALRAGHINVVKASLSGSIIGNLLLVLGLSLVAGGIRHSIQRFSAHLLVDEQHHADDCRGSAGHACGFQPDRLRHAPASRRQPGES